MSEVVFTATCGFANVYPIGSPIAGPLKAFGIDKGFKEIEGVPIDFLPVSGDPSGSIFCFVTNRGEKIFIFSLQVFVWSM
jgi:hypothetical protein